MVFFDILGADDSPSFGPSPKLDVHARPRHRHSGGFLVSIFPGGGKTEAGHFLVKQAAQRDTSSAVAEVYPSRNQCDLCSSRAKRCSPSCRLARWQTGHTCIVPSDYQTLGVKSCPTLLHCPGESHKVSPGSTKAPNAARCVHEKSSRRERTEALSTTRHFSR